MWALLLGSYTRKEGMPALGRHFGFPNLDDAVVGCNGTPCLEKPTLLAEEPDEFRSIKNADFVRALGRARAHQRQLAEAVALGERAAIERLTQAAIERLTQAAIERLTQAAIERLTQAAKISQQVLEAVRGRSLTSGKLRVDPSIKPPRGQMIPIGFIEAMQKNFKGDWLLKLEEGDADSLLSMTEPHRALCRRLAIKGRSADPNEPGEVLWEHLPLPYRAASRRFWIKMVSYLPIESQRQRRRDYEAVLRSRQQQRPAYFQRLSRSVQLAFDGNAMLSGATLFVVDDQRAKISDTRRAVASTIQDAGNLR